MARKSVIEKVESMMGIINKRYVLSTSEAFEVYEKTSGPIEAIAVSFRYGYMQGVKAARAEMKKGGAVNE